ncbi:sulfatase family protein [Lutibacter citreus]|uniref:sulfatase family protein n=1 Tax=Lutibacter citreus TaxID=2138210 RepID=UPI000DBE0E16|nr:sulfatase [Lutibacter citreus]
MKLKFALYALLLSLSLMAQKKKQPNFLIISCEDISPYLSFYGDKTAHTPNLDKLAEKSLVFDNAFATVGVCAPSRSSIITGMYPVSIGTHNMRTGGDVQGWGNRTYKRSPKRKRIDQEGIPFGTYSVVAPPEVKCFTTLLRKEGYFCTNNKKTDYQFAAPLSSWDENGETAHFKNRDKNQPFCSVFNLVVTHESRIWLLAKDSLRVNPKKVPLHSYWPDNDIVRTDMARNYSNIEMMDSEAGKIIQELEDSGEYDNTYILFYSDHGGPLPRGKRAIYDSGLKIPFMVKLPKNKNNGRTDELISGVDIAPTILSLADIKVPEYMQGQAFLGKQKQVNRDYVFGSADRFDEDYDRIRCIRDKEHMLVFNYYLNQASYLDLEYRRGLPMMQKMLELRDAGKLNKIQMQWFNPKKVEIEFYDVNEDPEQVNNIASDPKYKNKIESMLAELARWQEEVKDKGSIPEATLIKMQWPDFKQPITKKPVIKKVGGKYQVNVVTEGADIVYRYSNSNENIKELDHWNVYQKELAKEKGKYLHIKASRIGYADSETVIIK